VSARAGRTPRWLLALGLAVALAGCASVPRGAGDYAAFGGREGIEAVVEEMLVRVVEDPRIGHYFAESNLVRVHQQLSDQVCELVGGPCTYGGFPMEEVHAGRGIDEEAFNHLVGHLVAAMEARGVPVPAQNRLLAKLAPMRPQVIHR
jgi:hemoglobin